MQVIINIGIVIATIAGMELLSCRFKAFKSDNRYLAGIRRAHKIHHKSTEKRLFRRVWVIGGK
jgi:hypothetical protein